MINIVGYKGIERYTLAELTCDNYDERDNCFIGQVGDGPKDSLYIVIYDSIALVNDLSEVWTNPGCNVEVQRFVDMDVYISEA